MALHKRLQRNKCPIYCRKIQIGSSSKYSAFSPKGGLGGKNRSKRRLFSFTHKRGTKALSASQSRRSSVGIPSRPIWPKRNAPDFSDGYESAGKKMEAKRNPGVYLPGRHFLFGAKRKNFGKTSQVSSQRPVRCRIQKKYKEIHTVASTKNHPFGVCRKSGGGKNPAPPSKIEKFKKGAGKICHKKGDGKKTDCSHFRPGTVKPAGLALSEGIYHRNGPAFGKNGPRILGQKISHFPRNKKRVEKSRGNIRILVGEKLSPKVNKNSFFRFQRFWLGGE